MQYLGSGTRVGAQRWPEGGGSWIPLFDYLRSLSTTVERVAAGLFTLESIADAVNENFMAFCHQRGDAETVRICREYMSTHSVLPFFTNLPLASTMKQREVESHPGVP